MIEYNLYKTMNRIECIEIKAQNTMSIIQIKYNSYTKMCKNLNAQNTIDLLNCIELQNSLSEMHSVQCIECNALPRMQ